MRLLRVRSNKPELHRLCAVARMSASAKSGVATHRGTPHPVFRFAHPAYVAAAMYVRKRHLWCETSSMRGMLWGAVSRMSALARNPGRPNRRTAHPRFRAPLIRLCAVIYGELGDQKARNFNDLLIDDRVRHLWTSASSMPTSCRAHCPSDERADDAPRHGAFRIRFPHPVTKTRPCMFANVIYGAGRHLWRGHLWGDRRPEERASATSGAANHRGTAHPDFAPSSGLRARLVQSQ
jgi:hypothetical protein